MKDKIINKNGIEYVYLVLAADHSWIQNPIYKTKRQAQKALKERKDGKIMELVVAREQNDEELNS